MTRLTNRETLIVVFGGLLAVLLIGWLANLGGVTLLLVAAWLVCSLIVAMKVQHALLPIYLKLGFNQRALELAVDIRESAPNKRKRDLCSLELAMVQTAMGRFKEALKTLNNIKEDAFGEPVKALILANRAWCRAHVGKDLDKALKEAKEAKRLAPQEGLLHYFEGLALHKKGLNEDARAAVEKSLEEDPDPNLPSQGERALVFGDILSALGESKDAQSRWQEAKRQGRGKGPLSKEIEERLESLREPEEKAV